MLPRAYVVHHATVLADDDARGAGRCVHLDPRADVILDAPPSPPPTGSGMEPARVTVAERKRVVVEADAPTAGVLVFSDAWYPGWRVTVDGAPAPLLRADYALRGVALPAGRHVVEFTFRSRPAAARPRALRRRHPRAPRLRSHWSQAPDAVIIPAWPASSSPPTRWIAGTRRAKSRCRTTSCRCPRSTARSSCAPRCASSPSSKAPTPTGSSAASRPTSSSPR